MTGLEITLGVLLAVVLLAAFFLFGRQWRGRGSSEEENSFQLLQQQVEGLRGQVTESLRAVGTDVNSQIHQLQESVAQRLAENVEVAQRSGQQMGQGINQALDAVGGVREQLGKLEEASRRIFDVGKDIASLQDLLQAPQFRGGLGEFLLEELLSQLFPRNFYDMQFTFESGERVDAVLYVGPGRIPIDSKFPLESFRKASETGGAETEVRQARRRFRTDIKKHVDDIARKYIRPKENFYDFALMYIPAENVYYELMIRDEGRKEEGSLMEYATSRKVIPISPNTLYAYLQVILMGLRGLQVEQSARKILAGLGQLQTELGKMEESFDKVGSQLQYARNNYEDARRRMKDFAQQLAQLSSLSESSGEQLVLTALEKKELD